MLEITGVSKRYGQLEVLKDVHLTVEPGSFVGIVGKSGAGKSTLLHIAGTLDKPDSGEVSMNGTVISALTGNALSDFRNRHVGFIFQFHHLLPEFTAVENVMIPALLARMTKAEAHERASRLLQEMELGARIEHKPGSLSGGEQQRVAIARALINEPDIVFADEPTGNLDSGTSTAIHQLFLHLNESRKQTFIIVTHNEKFADICSRQIHMADGRIIQP